MSVMNSRRRIGGPAGHGDHGPDRDDDNTMAPRPVSGPVGAQAPAAVAAVAALNPLALLLLPQVLPQNGKMGYLLGNRYSITSSARARNVGGISRPSALAVLRLRASSNLVGA